MSKSTTQQPAESMTLLRIRHLERKVERYLIVNSPAQGADQTDKEFRAMLAENHKQQESLESLAELIAAAILKTNPVEAALVFEIKNLMGDIPRLRDEWPKLCAALQVLRVAMKKAGNQAGIPTAKTLNPTQRKIVALCRKKALPGIAITRKLELSAEHGRRVLAKLVRDGHLSNGPDGYRAIRARAT